MGPKTRGNPAQGESKMAKYSQWVDDALALFDADVPVSVIGPPGVGKTWQAESLHRLYWGAKADAVPFETVMAALSDPTDFTGILTVSEKTGETVRIPPSWARRIVAAGGGTVFLDEATLATPATWTALLRVILNKVVGDLVLPPATRFILASNPVEMTNAGNLFPPAGANRVGHLEAFCPEPNDWGDWLIGHSAETGDEHDRKAATAFASFVARRGHSFLLNVPKTEEKRAEAWASPRSCHAAARVLASAYRRGALASNDGQERTIRAIGSVVGGSWAGEFAVWLTENDLPDPRAVLLGQETVTFDASRPDKARPICLSVANEAVKGQARDKTERAVLVEAAWGVLLAGAKAGLADTIESAAEVLNQWRSSPAGGGGSATATPAKCPNEFKALTEVFKQVRMKAVKK